jgi:membrane fusion protein (multidrug efflux system)
MRRWQLLSALVSLVLLASANVGCGKEDVAATEADSENRGGGPEAGREGRRGGPEGRSGGRPGGSPGGFGGFGTDQRAAVPVEVAPVERRAISAFLETNGTLEAENDVDIVTRTSGPIEELLVEEGMKVRKGQLLARIDPDEIRARLEVAKVTRDDAKMAYDRAKALVEDELLSREAYDQAKATYESAEAQLFGEQIVLGYTDVKAPFDGVVSARYVKLAQFVSNNERLFRLTSFDPLLCPIQVPERELPNLHVGQDAYVKVEAWPEERFPAKVLRISPVVDATSGTVKVTLEVSAPGKLRPGMFTGVFLETETRADALVVPKGALSLESIGDTVYVAAGDTASRREVELGFQEGDFVEVREGLAEGEDVIVVGHDGLSDGTPIQVLSTAAGGGPRR